MKQFTKSQTKMKLHKNILIGLHNAFAEAMQDNKYADKVLERTFKSNKKWGAKDRAFVSEVFYEIIRWKRHFEHFTQKPFETDYIYHYIVAYLLFHKIPFEAIPDFKTVYIKKIKENFKKPFPSIAVKYSIPDWLQQRFEKELPKSWQKEMEMLNQKAEVILRVNTIKTTPKKLIERLAEDNITLTTIPNYPDALRLERKRNLFLHDSFKEGLFEVQDASSQKVAQIAQPKPGMKVIDSCAGAGGKTLHLASMMQNKGSIIALDIYDWKLQELKKRAKRNGIHNITTKVIEDTKVIKRLHQSADIVLIDAPCSGTGVLRRNPDAKWKLDTDFIERMITIQKDILQRYASMVKTQGSLVYATCSLLPSENAEQIQHFLDNNSQFKLLEMHTILPSQSGFDGFFIAKMERIE